MDKKLGIEPFDPEKHEPIDTVGGMKATEYLASEPSPEGSAWNIPTIWYDKKTKKPVFLGDKDNSDRAWNAAYRYEKETGIKFPRYKNIESAVNAAINRSKDGGATKEKLGMAKGGSTMNRQMSMFEEGGIADDGMNRDPVSGNEIPSGSLASEVRDDIPAQLSEGEYVVPADVVRYFGVKVFEDMRMEAKIGLREMEQDGRIGGEPVEPNKGMTEADLAGLEQMMRTGVANGGLMDKMAYTAMNDPLVNKKLNEGGMTVGFAAGGMPKTIYNDPTRVDQVIGQFMQMTKNNPGIMDELAKRGITINRTPATNQPTQMQAQNAPAQTTNPVINQAPIKAAEGTYLDPLSMTGLGTTIQPNSLNTTNTQNQSYITSPTSISSMYGIPGGSYFYQGPGVPKSPEEVEKAPVAPVTSTTPVCAPGTVYDEESNSCVPELEPTRDKDNMDGIGGTEMSTPYVEKGWRVQSTEQLDWSNAEDFDAYMKELSKPQEKISGLAKAVSLTNPLWGPAMVIGQKMERKATINKIKAMENIANLIGDSVRAASAVKAGESYKANMTEDQKAFADTQNGEGYTITLVNQIMGKGFLDDVEGTRGNGFHSVADLQNMPQYKKDELKAAIEANNARLREAALSSAQKKKDAEAAKIVEEQKKAKQKAQAEYKASQAQKEKNKAAAAAALAPTSKGQAQAKQIVATSKKRKTKSGATVGGKADTQKNLNKVNKQLKNIASGGSGGFNKGGLMKKPNKK
jgi:hypothetical protein